MDDLSLRVYLENGSDAMRGGWLELPVVPERLDAFMRGVVGVDDGGGYAVVDHEPGWFGDVLGSDLESFSVSSLNLAARCVAHAHDLAVADSVDGDVFLDMLATAAMSVEASQARGAAGGADEFDTFGEPADVQDGYLPGDPADPTTMLDPSSGMGATL